MFSHCAKYSLIFFLYYLANVHQFTLCITYLPIWFGSFLCTLPDHYSNIHTLICVCKCKLDRHVWLKNYPHHMFVTYTSSALKPRKLLFIGSNLNFVLEFNQGFFWETKFLDFENEIQKSLIFCSFRAHWYIFNYEWGFFGYH